MKKIVYSFIILILIAVIYIIYAKNDNVFTEKLYYYNDGVFMTIAKPLDHELYNYKDNEEKWSVFAIIGKSKNAPHKQLPMVKPVFDEKPSDFALYWLGHSAAIIELDNKRILIDPVFDNAAPIPFVVCRYGKSVIKRKELPKIDYILITHNHYDHLEKKTVKHLKNNKFIVPLGVGNILADWGVKKENITELAWNDEFKNDSIYIKALTGIHFSGRSLTDGNKTLWNSYIIQGRNKKIFWSGDTGYGTQFKEFGELYGPFDLAAIEIDAWNKNWANIHMFPHEVIKATKELNAKYLLPIHWAVFDLAMHPWNESIEMIIKEANKNTVNVLTPKIGEKLQNQTVFDYWWRD